MLAHVMGGSIYAFATMLAAFLTGIALAAAWRQGRRKQGKGRRRLRLHPGRNRRALHRSLRLDGAADPRRADHRWHWRSSPSP